MHLSVNELDLHSERIIKPLLGWHAPFVRAVIGSFHHSSHCQAHNNSSAEWVQNGCRMDVQFWPWSLHLLNGVNFKGYSWYTLHSSPHAHSHRRSIENHNLYSTPKFSLFKKIIFWKELNIFEKCILKGWRIEIMPIKSYICLLSTHKVWTLGQKKIVVLALRATEK